MRMRMEDKKFEKKRIWKKKIYVLTREGFITGEPSLFLLE
jgi:hypothetical protein